jgi:hypothetical protein
VNQVKVGEHPAKVTAGVLENVNCSSTLIIVSQQDALPLQVTEANSTSMPKKLLSSVLHSMWDGGL